MLSVYLLISWFYLDLKAHSVDWLSEIQATSTENTEKLGNQSFCDAWVSLDSISHSSNCNESVQLIGENVSSSKHIIICYASETNWIKSIWSYKTFFFYVDVIFLYFFGACGIGTYLYPDNGAELSSPTWSDSPGILTRLCSRSEYTHFARGVMHRINFQIRIANEKRCSLVLYLLLLLC